MTGYLWYGDTGGVHLFDMAEKAVRPVSALAGCREVAASPLEDTYAFVCGEPEDGSLKLFTLAGDEVRSTAVNNLAGLSDPILAPDGSRTLFRVRRFGEVFDLYLHMHEAGYGKVVSKIGAACFGLNNRSLFVAEDDQVASMVLRDVTEPEKIPESGLPPLASGSGAVRDLQFHLGTKELVVCSGTRVFTCDLTGKGKRIVYDAATAQLPGSLRIPYRARFSHDATRVVVLTSVDGETGAFVIVARNGGKPKLIAGPKPVVGGFAWTVDTPARLR